jgi:tryptophan synthase beta subunit
VLHGARTFVLQDDDGQTIESHSISAGLDYPGVGPQHAYLADSGRATYEAGDGCRGHGRDARSWRCTEGIIPAIESSHALAGALRLAPKLAAEKGKDAILLINLSGRGDKDMGTAPSVAGDRSTPASSPGRATARHHRDRPAVLRSGHGRPDHPGSHHRGPGQGVLRQAGL